MLQKPWLCRNTAARCRQILNVFNTIKVYKNYQCKATILYIYQSQLLACSKSGSRFALAWVGTGFRRLGSLDRKSRSRVCRSSFFPDGSKKAYQRKFDFARISSFLQKPHNINLSFLFFVVCNTWSFRHNLNQSNQLISFCDYILYCSLHFTYFPFVWKSILILTIFWSPEKRWTEIDCSKNHQQDGHTPHCLKKRECLVSAFSSPRFAGLIYSRWLESVMKAICVTDQTPDKVVCAILCHSWK